MKNAWPDHYRLTLSGIVALTLAMGLGRFAQTPILPYMTEAFDWSRAEAGYLASANFFGYFAGCLVTSLHSFAISRRHFLWAVWASAATTLLMALPGNLTLLSILRFMGGFASALVLVLASSLILQRLDRSARPDLGSYIFMGPGLGIAISAIVAGLLGPLGQSGLWITCGVLSFVGLYVIRFLMPKDLAEREEKDRPKAAMPLWRLKYLLPAYGLVGFGYVITATFISLMLRQNIELAHLETYAWLVVGLSVIPAAPFWAWLGRRLNLRAAFALACLVEGLGVALAAVANHPATLLASAAMLGGTFISLTAMGIARARPLLPDHTQAAIGLMSTSFALGQMLGPAFAGIVADHTGSFLWPSAIAATGLVVATLLAALPDPPARPSR